MSDNDVRDSLAAQPEREPRKAYLVTYTVTNEMDGVIYAASAADARERFSMGDYDHSEFEVNGNDGRTGGVRVRRLPEGDREDV